MRTSPVSRHISHVLTESQLTEKIAGRNMPEFSLFVIFRFHAIFFLVFGDLP